MNSDQNKKKYLKEGCAITYKLMHIERSNDTYRMEILKIILLHRYADNCKISANFREVHTLLNDLLNIKEELSVDKAQEIKEILNTKFNIPISN